MLYPGDDKTIGYLKFDCLVIAGLVPAIPLRDALPA